MDEMLRRLAKLEADLASAQRDIKAMRDSDREIRMEVDARHKDNTKKLDQNAEKLQQIELNLEKIAIYFNVGRWIMHGVAAMFGAAGIVILEYVFGVKH